MKKICFIFALIFVFSLVSCASKDNVPSGMKQASNENADYSLYVPDNGEWTVDSQTRTVSAYHSDKSSVNVMAWDLPNSDDDIASWWKSYQNDFDDVFADFTLLSDGEDTTLGGVAAKKYVYTATLGANADKPDETAAVTAAETAATPESVVTESDSSAVVYKFMQIAAKKNNYIYLFTYTSTVELYDEHTEDVQSMLDEFSFAK